MITLLFLIIFNTSHAYAERSLSDSMDHFHCTRKVADEFDKHIPTQNRYRIRKYFELPQKTWLSKRLILAYFDHMVELCIEGKQ